MKISQILDKIDEYQLFVPAFQREYVWKRGDAKRLMESLIKDYPTGTMLTWETNHPPELKGNTKYDPRQGAVKLILDGQQRITTLYMLIRGVVPPYYSIEEILHDPRNLYANVESLELNYYNKRIMKKEPRWVNITDIFQRNIRSRDIVRELEQTQEISRAYEDQIDDNFRAIERILEHDFLEQSVPVKAKVNEAIDIFYIVNASGVSLTEAELALAQISGYWPQAREKFKAKIAQLGKKGFVFKLDFIVYVLLGVLHQSGSDMRKLHSEDNLERILEAWQLLDSHTLDYVMDVMKTHAFIDHTKEINSIYALVPIIVYTFKKGQNPLTQNEINKIVKWFYYSQIRRRYISQLQQKLDKDNSIAATADNPFDQLLNIIQAERPLKITKDELVGVDGRNPLYNLMRWYFKSQNAICFSTGIGLRRDMNEKYTLTYDYIFPYSLLKEIGYNQQNRLKYAQAQEITNRVILTQYDKRSQDLEQAADYLAHVKSQFPDGLKNQAIPTDEELWKIENFEQFLDTRRQMLADHFNAYLNGITETLDTDVEVSIEDLIAEGESNELEFKSSMLWSYNENKINKDLQKIILKTIAALSNGNGGTLLIGVDDDGNVLGLEHDYTDLKGNKDEFELRLRSIANHTFGVNFATRNLTVSFPVVEDVEICKVDVVRGKKPCFIKVKKKNAPPTDVFYVRSGNSSQPFSTREMASYIAARFEET